jgi:N-acetylglucosaminyldiphosphoundecaprenol N-acetyl-beta-D-mannosaminyltransferase
MGPIPIFHSFINIRTIDEYFDLMAKSLKNRNRAIFFYLNTYSSYLCDKDENFRKAFNAADYIIPDGSSIVLAVKHLRGITIEKVTTNHTFFEKNAQYFDNEGASLFLFGSTPPILSRAVANLHRSYPGIKIAGTHHGYMSSRIDSEEVIALIRDTAPDILFVGMGMPLSELWIAEHRHQLNVPCIMTVGNLIDIIAGEQRIAPRWIFKSGFEWLYRMMWEPIRLTPRYFKANSRFLLDFLIALATEDHK